MGAHIFYLATSSPALRAAGEALKSRGYGVVDRPCDSVTDVLLPVPSFDADGSIKGGGSLEALLSRLPKHVTILGGNLTAIPGYKTFDLLQDPTYLASNASITAYCAVRLTLIELPVTLRKCPVLIIGWGRIGKCLAALLRALEADVTVAARKEADRAMAHTLGYRTAIPAELADDLNQYRVIYNTVPAPVISQEQAAHCRENCLKIDLASVLGIDAPDVVWARGLPGKDAPESSGKLIAKTTIRLIGRKEQPQ